MKRLYLQIYLTVIASLVAFAIAAGALWWLYVDQVAPHPMEVISEATQSFPPANAPQSEHQDAVNRLAMRLRGDAALYAPDRTPIAQAGRPIGLPSEAGHRGPHGEMGGRGPRAWTVPLADGRWLVGRASRDFFRARRPGPLLVLALVALAVGVGAYPVVRRVTRRLEKLKARVDDFGAGELSARVTVEGRDEVAQLASSFNRAAAQIEVLVGAHKALLANASHELRTPLARIRVAVELMKDSADPARRAELEHDIAELDTLIEEILLASRLDAMQEQAVLEPVDLLGLAAEECARYEEAELDGEPLSVRGDPRLLRRMIRNLLQNARQHGAPPIEIRVRNIDAGAEIRVRDHGAGIPEAEREKVFEPFYRRPGTTVGAGLGLALVRQIARRHGGDARYVAGEGFEVQVPLEASYRSFATSATSR